LRSSVDNVKPPGRNKSHPFADPQKSTVGATPPSQVDPVLNPPDCRERHMTELKRRVVPSTDAPNVNGPVMLDPNVILVPAPLPGVAPVKVNT